MGRGKKKKVAQEQAQRQQRLDARVAIVLHLLGAAFLLYWYRSYFTDLWVASVDLPGHIAVIERLAAQLGYFRVRFFDPHWFAGWPAFQFYAPLSHILAALLSFPLSLLSAEPARLSAHLLLLASVISLPACLHYFAQQILNSYQESYRPYQTQLTAIVSFALGFWFLNHDYQWHGIGAAAALHVGLFSQALAWPLLLLYLAFLSKVLFGMHAAKVPAALCFAALFLCHSLTAVFAAYLAFILALLFSARRGALVEVHLRAMLLTGFWLIPFLCFSSSYTGLDIYRPKGDFLEIVFRYPLQGLISSFYAALEGTIAAISPTYFFLMALAFFSFAWTELHRSKLFASYGIAALLGVVLFSSGFIASSIPLGLHYYRFLAYLFLLCTALCIVIPALWYQQSRQPKLVASVLCVCSLVSTISTVAFPHYEYDKISALRGEAQFKNEQQVLSYLAREKRVGRVLFSYFSDYEVYPFLSAHYFASQLWKQNQQDTLNGLFIQSALGYRMPVASAALLGIPGYHIPLLFTDNAELPEPIAFQQLLDVGVTHVVLGRTALTEALRSRAVEAPRFIGPYAIVRIAEAAPPALTAVEKPVIAYSDLEGTAPFHLFEMYFYSKGELYEAFELILVEEGQALPPGTVALVVNTASSEESVRAQFAKARGNSLGRENALPELIRFNHSPYYALSHYRVWYQHNQELDHYQALERYLGEQIRLPQTLRRLPGTRSLAPAGAKKQLQVDWSDSAQTFRISGMRPGSLYRLDYSYFPYWESEAAEVYRGMPERIFLQPQQATLELRYSLFSRWSTWIGYLCTAFGLFWCGNTMRKRRRTAM